MLSKIKAIFRRPEATSFAAPVQALPIRILMLYAVHCGEVWREGQFMDRFRVAETSTPATAAAAWAGRRSGALAYSL
jgi:hypothetical protein